jgi:alpha-mannosidase
MVFIDFYYPEYHYPKKDLEELWKSTLKNQFHDILPGSSIPEVYDDCWEDWKSQESIIDKHINHIGNILSKKSKDLPNPSTAEFLIYNPLSWERTSRIFIPITVFKEKTELKDKEKPPYAKLILNNKADDVYICQPISADPEEAIDLLPAGWWTVLTLAPISIQKARIKLLDKKEENAIKNQQKIKNIQISHNSLSNDIIEIHINEESGAIISLFGKNINEGQNLLKGDESNLTFCYRDRVPIQYHAWNLTPEYWNHQLPFSNNKDVRISIADQGPIFSTLMITKSIGSSPVTQKISLFKDFPQFFLSTYQIGTKKMPW